MSKYDERLIVYCELHNETELALFSGKDLMQLARMADIEIALTSDRFYCDKRGVTEVIKRIREKQTREQYHYQGGLE